MLRITLSLSLMALLFAGGCLNVNARGPDIDLGGGPSSSEAAAANDTRPASQIQAENSQLRARLAKLEPDYKAWVAAVDGRKAEIKDMERQLSELKKDRDRWKKAAKN